MLHLTVKYKLMFFPSRCETFPTRVSVKRMDRCKFRGTRDDTGSLVLIFSSSLDSYWVQLCCVLHFANARVKFSHDVSHYMTSHRIHYENTLMQYTAIFHGCKNVHFSDENFK